ncbi:nucleotide sugar dehydrogenase [Cellulosimicrobium arenosum]|uniref:Nucleotide sugar dehydrogenase n=1 Tax=Cellulosimicrobium arenosum TaxID=2708133 RepID=A0A927J2U1_9MICO|nr:nucleotide sugar dehydrogenase [Cellulosimicrobium arenosum]
MIGLGYVGLPLAREAVRGGLVVRGFDVTTSLVDALNEGRSHVDDISDGDVAEMLGAGFRATGDVEDIRGAAAVVICVPTPLGQDGGPDLGAVIAATRTIAGVLEPGMVVVLESTTYPGTTEEVLKPILEEGGLRCGEDFHLAFSPERIDPGNATYGMKNTPKVVGGLTPEATERAAALYSRFVDTVVVAKGAREAETAKLLENTYRHINIALVNEMARFCHELGIDLWDVIRLAKTKPFGFQAFYPGPGVGGHCIPIDPNYLSHNVRSRLGYPFRFVELAQEINATMPAYVVRRAQDILNEDAKAMRGSRVLLLGVTYKPNIADQRESPAVAVARNLLSHGADLVFHDPHVEQWHVNGDTLDRVEDLDTAIAEADLVILVQNHSAYDVDVLAEKSVRFFDTKGATTHPDAIRL